MFQKKYVPYSTLYELTLKCNMKCLHCGSSAGSQRINELTTDEWNTLTKDLYDLGCRYITLLGGEPFLRKDWFEISNVIKEHGMDLTIISNGLLIDKEKVEKLRKLNLHSIAISLDGARPETHDKIRQVNGSFKQSMNAISLLTNAGINTTVITTLNTINFEDLPAIRDFLLDKRIAWQLQFAAPIGRFSKELMLSKTQFYSAALFIASNRKKYDAKRLRVMGAHCFGYNSQYLPNINVIPIWRGCPAGLSTLGIQSNGGIKGCLSLPDEYCEGNLKKETIKDIWNDKNRFAYNRRFKKHDLDGECKNCKYGKTCKGGCSSGSISLNGKTHCNPYCLKLIEDSTDFKNFMKECFQ
jgi:radical SAM protein with 4Fe4S-binding SPASM domain